VACALENFDVSLVHLGGKLARELDIVAHLAARRLRGHVAAGRDVVVLAHEEAHWVGEKRHFGGNRLAPDHLIGIDVGLEPAREVGAAADTCARLDIGVERLGRQRKLVGGHQPAPVRLRLTFASCSISFSLCAGGT
jgi:hypothetical protein